MDLTEFIKARLDEDERDIDTCDHDSGQCDYLRGVHLEPERALREVEAKRAILALHAPSVLGSCSVCVTSQDGYPEEWLSDGCPCATVRQLGAIYAGHPEYRQEWAQES